MSNAAVKFFVVLLILGLLAGIGWALRPFYKDWKVGRLVRQAEAFKDQADFRNAELSLRQALRTRPRNVEVWRAMAELSEIMQDPRSLGWRIRVVQLEPDVPKNRLDLAFAALRLKHYNQAQEALDGFSQADRETGNYHQAAAALSLATNNPAAARTHFEEALRIEPTNGLYRLNLAVLKLGSQDTNGMQEARAELVSMRTNQDLKGQVLRSLISDALGRRELAEATALSDELLAGDAVLFGDRIQHLDILLTSKDPTADAFLTQLRDTASTNAASVFAMSTWYLGQNRGQEALDWIKQLPAEVQEQQPYPMALTDCLLSVGDWDGIVAQLKDKNWGMMEFVRLAAVAKALRELGQADESKESWDEAFKATGGRREALTSLVNLCGKWGWEDEMETVLWAIVLRFPQEGWAVTPLRAHYHKTGNTKGLFNILTLIVKRQPKNMSAKNDLATLSLLLSEKVGEAHQMAEEVFNHDPNNLAFRSTRAYSLHLQRRGLQAKSLLADLPLKDLERPSIALYYGAILAGIGDLKTAAAYLDLAKGGNLLPEEQELLEKTLKRL